MRSAANRSNPIIKPIIRAFVDNLRFSFVTPPPPPRLAAANTRVVVVPVACQLAPFRCFRVAFHSGSRVGASCFSHVRARDWRECPEGVAAGASAPPEASGIIVKLRLQPPLSAVRCLPPLGAAWENASRREIARQVVAPPTPLCSPLSNCAPLLLVRSLTARCSAADIYRRACVVTRFC